MDNEFKIVVLDALAQLLWKDAMHYVGFAEVPRSPVEVYDRIMAIRKRLEEQEENWK